MSTKVFYREQMLHELNYPTAVLNPTNWFFPTTVAHFFDRSRAPENMAVPSLCWPLIIHSPPDHRLAAEFYALCCPPAANPSSNRNMQPLGYFLSLVYHTLSPSVLSISLYKKPEKPHILVSTSSPCLHLLLGQIHKSQFKGHTRPTECFLMFSGKNISIRSFFFYWKSQT